MAGPTTQRERPQAANRSSHEHKSASARRGSGRASGTSAIPFAEWAAAGVGLALVVAAVVFMLYKGFARDGAPPQVVIETESIVQHRGGYLVTIRAVNRGDVTAADVKVEGQLQGASGVAETSEMTFQFLPPNSERKGGLFFTKNPRDFELKLMPKGYEVP
jgi:uncharacterized protein (TIGR02588 family)